MGYSVGSDIQAKPYWFRQTIADLSRHEGFRQYAYPDPLSHLGKKYVSRKWGWGYEPGNILLAKYGEREEDGRPWTVGIGFTHGVTPSTQMGETLANKKLSTELTEHLGVLDKLIPSWRNMPDYVKTVLANMAYNLGYNRLRPFAPTLAEFDKGNYKTAAGRLRNTLWFKQVGARARELVERLETGKVQDEYRIT